MGLVKAGRKPVVVIDAVDEPLGTGQRVAEPAREAAFVFSKEKLGPVGAAFAEEQVALHVAVEQ